MLLPAVRHVATCLRCGWRRSTRLTNSYPLRCENGCAGQLEHLVAAIDTVADLRQVRQDGTIRRGVGRRGAR